MRYKNFIEVEKEIIEHFRDNRLIPILGAGFSAGSKTIYGVVPDGKQMSDYMREALLSTNEITKEELNGKSFQKLAQYYNSLIKVDKRIEYISKNFIGTKLTKDKKSILSIPWPYIYTFNIDDSVEKKFKIFYCNSSNARY